MHLWYDRRDATGLSACANLLTIPFYLIVCSDYPDFFKKLYMLFDRNLMHVKYRARFFSQVDIFLSSPYVSSFRYIVAICRDH